YIQQTMQISAMWNHQIDATLIYVVLNSTNGDIDKTIEVLFKFEQWTFRNNNEQKYKNKTKEFLEKRCCNHNVNLFCMFISEKCKKEIAIEVAAIETVHCGLPFVEKDKHRNSNRFTKKPLVIQ
ncbi:hypothetical protein RFI_36264, partial [Reticulomyxa filosa]